MHEEGIVITADEFRKKIGETIEIWDEMKQENTIQFKDGRKTFDDLKRRCKVIARCTSQDKFIFISGIK